MAIFWDFAGSPVVKTSSFHCKLSHSVMSNFLLPHGLQHARLPCPSPTPGAYLNSCPSSRWCHPTITSPVIPFSSHLQSFPESGSLPRSQFFTLVAKGMEFQLQPQSCQWIFRTDSLEDGLVYHLAVQGTLKSSPTPQFKSISSLVFSFLYGPTLTSIHDYWENHNFD